MMTYEQIHETLAIIYHDGKAIGVAKRYNEPYIGYYWFMGHNSRGIGEGNGSSSETLEGLLTQLAYKFVG